MVINLMHELYYIRPFLTVTFLLTNKLGNQFFVCFNVKEVLQSCKTLSNLVEAC